MQTSLLDSKSILAKLMATENIHIEQRKTSTASFDVRSRVLVVPILDEKISSVQYDLFMGHEVGHALYTPMDGLLKAHELEISSTICNVLEDVRIEKRMKNKYPGLRPSFTKAYRELFEKDFFGTTGVDLNTMNYIDRVNIFTKVGPSLGIKFTEFERTLLDEIESTETYDDVIAVAKKVVDYMKQQREEQKQKQKLEEIEDDESGENDGRFDYRLGDDESEGDEIELDENEESFSESYGQEDDGIEETVASDVKSHTDEAYNKNITQLFEGDVREKVYLNIPKVDLDTVVVDYKQFISRLKNDDAPTDLEEYNRVRNSNNKSVSYLVKEFEMRKNAEQMKRASVAKTGELNMNKVFSYNYTDDIFRKMTIVPEGKSHGLVMFIDWSGSMQDHIENTLNQLFALVMFCKKVNIPFDVYAFTSTNLVKWFQLNNIQQKYQKDDLMLNSFNLINLLSSRMSSAELTYVGSVLTRFVKQYRYSHLDWLHLGQTPLNEAMIAALEVVPKFKQDYKLQIVNVVVLSDGDGHSLTSRYIEEDDGTMRPGNISYGLQNHSPYDLVLRDPVTKHQEVIRNTYGGGNGYEQTKCLVKLLKHRTGANILGFYVLKTREFHYTHKFWPVSADFNLLKQEFRKNKYAIVTGYGFDEYYLLRSESLDIDDETDFVVKENARTKGLVTAFAKYANARNTNRVILNRFIGMIA